MYNFLYKVKDNDTGAILLRTDDWDAIENFFNLEFYYRAVSGEPCNLNFKIYNISEEGESNV